MIVLDTDIVSVLMRRPPEGLTRRLEQVAPGDQSTTTITLAELAYGALKVGRPELYDRALDLLVGVTIFAFDDVSVPHYARVRVHLENEGKRLADPDLRIAAIALAYGLTLISGNVRHFARIPGLAVEDWTAP